MIAKETLIAAQRKNFDYQNQVRKASKGNAEALRQLFLFSADSAGGLGHRVTLKELEILLGRKKMLSEISSLDQSGRDKMQWFVDNDPAI